VVRHKMRGRDFLSLQPLDGDELEDLVEEALRLKNEGTKGLRPLASRVIGLLFEKPSMRTRVSFEVAVQRLGGHALIITDQEIQLGRRESIEDAGRVLSRYLDGLVVRTFGHDRIEELAAAADVPLVNALSDLCHPCQALADMLTILEYKGALRGLKLAYVGDGNNVTHSLMRAGTKLGMSVTVSTPPQWRPQQQIIDECLEYTGIYGSSCEIGSDPRAGVEGADVVYTDVWVSMGQEAMEEEALLHEFAAFQVNNELLEAANDDVMVMHCLPAHRGLEITDEVIDGSRSAVWDQAENRLHAQLALLDMIYG
jgi:ornithine carbamoyltransferase